MPNIDTQTLVAIEEGKDAVEEMVEARARLIFKLSLATKAPLDNRDSSWGDTYRLEDYMSWETYGGAMHVQFESLACGRGCCGSTGECLEIPFAVWDEPTQEAVSNWRNPIGQKREDKKEAEKKAQELKVVISEREQLERLKEKYGE